MDQRDNNANITLGRQGWADRPAAQLLGAGTSNSPAFSEVGLSANPAAMQHGLKVVQPPAPAAEPPAGPAAHAHAQRPGELSPAGPLRSTMHQPVTSTTPAALNAQTGIKAAPVPVAATAAAAAPRVHFQSGSSSMERSVSGAIQQQRQRMAPVLAQKARLAEQQQQQQQQPGASAAGAGGGAGSGEQGPAPVGTPIVVQPSASQQSWASLGLQHLKALLLGSPPDALSLGPPWTKWPDFARTNNINGIISGLWPSITAAITQDYVQQMLPQMMADAAKTSGAGVLTGLELVEFDLGPIPPRLDGLKVYDEVGDEQVLLELALAWGSAVKVTVGATLQLLGHTFQVPLTVQNLQFQARVRAAAQPLLDHFPYVGSAGFSLVEPPHVEFDLPLGGVDLMSLPGVRGLFRLGLRLASRQLLVYPKGIALPLVQGGAAAGGPEGMLEVHLVRIAGLRSEDLLGHSDPYVVLRLRQGRVLRSRTISNNNNPEYDETFKLLVDDLDTQVLQLIVMDEDLVGEGKVMGVAQMPLKSSAAVGMPRTKVPLSLTIHKLMSEQKGIGGLLQLPVKVAGVPLNAAAKGGRRAYESMAGALGVGGGRGRTTGVTQHSKVLDETGWLGPSEEFLDEIGKTAWKEDSSSSSSNQQQPQQEKTPSASAGGTAIASGQALLQPGSPAGSSSSYRTAFSRSSAGSSAAGSRSSSPAGRSAGTSAVAAVVPLDSRKAAGADDTQQAVSAAVAAATAAAAAARGGAAAASDSSGSSSAVVRQQRRLSAEGTPTPFGGTDSTIMAGSTALGSSSSGRGVPWGTSTGLNRLDSKSAPLPDRLDISYSPTPPAAAAYASPYYTAPQQLPPASPRSDYSSSSSSLVSGSTAAGGTRLQAVRTTKVSKVTRVLSRISRRSHSPEPREDADAPPAEVVEHNRKVQQADAAAGRQGLQEMQQDLTPGASARGLAGDQLKKIYRGTVFLELTYTPFLKPAGAPTGAGASPATSSARVSAANNVAIMPHDKGILAVTLVRARGLGGWQGEADPYVTLSLMDSAGAMRPGGGPDRSREQVMRSTTIYNEDSPRWNEKFDFIDVRADSVLLATVWDQATIIDAATSLRISRERFKDQVIGRVKVPVMDVANAGRIKRLWPLQGALMGELELVAQWIPQDQLGR